MCRDQDCDFILLVVKDGRRSAQKRKREVLCYNYGGEDRLVPTNRHGVDLRHARGVGTHLSTQNPIPEDIHISILYLPMVINSYGLDSVG